MASDYKRARSAETCQRNFTKHGLSRHPLYDTWYAMLRRCGRESYRDHDISVSEGWRHDPSAFIRWVEENLGPRPEGWSLDRTDNGGDYEPGNLRWASAEMQANNRGHDPVGSLERIAERRECLCEGEWLARCGCEAANAIALLTLFEEEEGSSDTEEGSVPRGRIPAIYLEDGCVCTPEFARTCPCPWSAMQRGAC